MNRQFQRKAQGYRKKILFIITRSEMGGAQKFLYHLVTNLDPRKFEMIIAAGANNQKPNLLSLLQEKNFKNISLKFLKREINPINDLLAIFEIRNLIKKTKPDILYLCSSKAGVEGAIAGKISVIKNLKIIYRIGGWSFNEPVSRLVKKIYLLSEKISAPLKDLIITNSLADLRQAKKLNIKPKDFKVIYNGIENKLEFLPRFAARKIFNIKNDEKVVGCIANFYKNKGHKYLIQAAAFIKNHSPQIKFFLIGEGQQRYELESLIQKLKLDNVFLTGYIENAHKYLKAFDVFVLPSLKEGFPWVLPEAGLAEVPVVAASVGGVPEIIKNNFNGFLVKPGSAQELAMNITELLNNEQLRKTFSENGKKLVCQKFTLEKMIKAHENIFLKIIL